jgi:hypothetical protein
MGCDNSYRVAFGDLTEIFWFVMSKYDTVRLLGSDGDILVVMSKSASDEVIAFCQKQLAGRERRFPF